MNKNDDKNALKQDFISIYDDIPKKNPLISLNDISEIRDIDPRTIKSYCKKLNIKVINGAIPIGSLIDLLVQNAKSFDGRRSKGNIKFDIDDDDIPDEVKKELESYQKDPFAPHGEIHRKKPILFKAYWDSMKSWILSQVQANRYIPVGDVKETLYLTISKFKDYFTNLQDKIDKVFPNNPDLQQEVSLWSKQTLIEIYDDLMESIDEFKLESSNPEKLEREKQEIIEKQEQLIDEYVEDKQNLDDRETELLKLEIEQNIDELDSDEPNLEDQESQKICENELKNLKEK